MRGILILGLAVMCLARPLWSQEKSDKAIGEKSATKSPTDQVADLNKEFEMAFLTFQKAYREAKTPEDRKKVVEEKYPKAKDYSGKFMELVKKFPNDPAAIDALTWVVGNDAGSPNATEAARLVLANHAKSERIGAICDAIAGQEGTAAVKFLEKILAENPHKPIQAQACFGLGQATMNLVEQAKNGAKDVGDAKELQHKAELYYERVIKDFSDVKSGSTSLADQAKGELFEFRNLAVGQPAPEIELQDINGKNVTLSSLKGKVVVLDIWATWCGPCRAMIPHERELVKRLADKPFVFVSISFDDTVEVLKKFIEQEPMPWTHWFNGAEGPLGKAWNIKYFPTIYVIDAKGIIRFKGVRGEELDRAVDKLLAEQK